MVYEALAAFILNYLLCDRMVNLAASKGCVCFQGRSVYQCFQMEIYVNVNVGGLNFYVYVN